MSEKEVDIKKEQEENTEPKKEEKKEENLHKGHRKRVRDRFLKERLEGFEPHQVIELLLFFSIPRRDTNPAAHRLINRFGSVDGVLKADKEELVEVEGIGEKSAELFHLLQLAIQRYLTSREDTSSRLINRREVMDQLIAALTGEPDGTICVLFCNRFVEPLDIRKYSAEEIGSPIASGRIIAKDGMEQNAGTIATGRKCSGKISFSPEEKEAYRDLDRMLRRLDMCLIDHFAVTEDGGEACFGQKELDFEFFTEA